MHSYTNNDEAKAGYADQGSAHHGALPHGVSASVLNTAEAWARHDK